MSKSTSAIPCPSPEELQEYCDLSPQKQATHPMAAHVANCGECQKRLRAYAMVDKALSHMMTPPEGLSGRILASVHTPELPQQLSAWPSIWWRRIFWGGMAAAACLAMTLGLWYQRNTPSTNTQVASNATKTSTEAPSPVVNQPSPASDRPEMLAAQTEPMPPPNSLVLERQTARRGNDLDSQAAPMQSVTRVGTQSGSSEARQVPLVDIQQPLPARVHHVWVVPDLGQAGAELGKLVGKKMEAASGTITMRIPDQDLQKLVDTLRSRHWALLSPNLPQPGQAEALRLTGHPVEYTMDIQPQEE